MHTHATINGAGIVLIGGVVLLGMIFAWSNHGIVLKHATLVSAACFVVDFLSSSSHNIKCILALKVLKIGKRNNSWRISRKLAEVESRSSFYPCATRERASTVLQAVLPGVLFSESLTYSRERPSGSTGIFWITLVLHMVRQLLKNFEGLIAVKRSRSHQKNRKRVTTSSKRHSGIFPSSTRKPPTKQQFLFLFLSHHLLV
jgi:hypothetical protein